MTLTFKDRNIFTTSGNTYEHIDGDGELIYYKVKNVKGTDKGYIISGEIRGANHPSHMEKFILNLRENQWFKQLYEKEDAQTLPK